MARPKKTGLDYFPKDVSFYMDRKIRRLMREFGAKGILIYDYILCVIYQDKGYYVEYDDHFDFDVSDILNCGISEELVKEVINGCIRVGLFDKDLCERCHILTSPGIQKRYLAAKRNAEIKDEFKVVKKTNVSDEKTNVSAAITLVSAAKTQQSKAKESRVKNNISPSRDISKSDFQESQTQQVDYKKLVDFFNNETKGVFGKIRYPLSKKRQESIRARIREYGKDAFEEMVKRAYESDFLKGDNKSGFRATFDWLIRPTNFQKTLEGNYNNRTPKTTNHSGIINTKNIEYKPF